MSSARGRACGRAKSKGKRQEVKAVAFFTFYLLPFTLVGDCAPPAQPAPQQRAHQQRAAWAPARAVAEEWIALLEAAARRPAAAIDQPAHILAAPAAAIGRDLFMYIYRRLEGLSAEAARHMVSAEGKPVVSRPPARA